MEKKANIPATGKSKKKSVIINVNQQFGEHSIEMLIKKIILRQLSAGADVSIKQLQDN